MLCWNKLGMFDYLTFVPLVPGEEDGEWPTSWSQDDCRGSGRERPIRSSRRWCASCFFLSLSSIFNRYPSCCPWSPGPASPSRPCGLPSGFWRQGVAHSLMEVWRRSLTWVWRSTSTRRPDSKVPGSRWGCGRLGCIVRAVGKRLFFAHLSRPWSIGWEALSFLFVCLFVRPSRYGDILTNLHFFQYIQA